MSAPTTVFLDVPLATTTAAIDTVAERKANAYSGVTVSTGVSNAWNFGTVNISSGAANSGVKTLFWKVTAANGNTTVDNFKFWLSEEGFELATLMKYCPLTCQAAGTTVNNDNLYVANAVTGNYTWTTVDTPSEPGAQNVFSAVDTTSIDITGVTAGAFSDVVALAAYFAVADNETTGTYWGADGDNPGYALRCSFKYDFS